MRKLIAVGVLVGGLLAGTGSAMAQWVPSNLQGGIGDPLTLAASGVVIPYITAGGTVAVVQIASPVSNNPNLHMQFFNHNCDAVGPSVGMPLTTNDIAFQVVNGSLGGPLPLPDGENGLVAISAVGPDGFTNVPLEAPIHARVFTFNPSDGSSRLLEPIILDTAEFPGNPHTWSPMRTAADFFSPLQTASVHTHLILICPKSTIQPGYFGPAPGVPQFPVIAPPFPVGGLGPVPHAIRVRIYEAGTEVFLRNTGTKCVCFTTLNLEEPNPVSTGTNGIDPVYGNAAAAPFGTYTELEEDPTVTAHSTFTGYTSVFTVNSPLNNFFGRLNNGNILSIEGTVTNAR